MENNEKNIAYNRILIIRRMLMRYKKPEWEIYELSCNTLRQKLYERIKGKVVVGVDDRSDILHIDVEFKDGFTYHYEKTNYLEYILALNGADEIVNEVINKIKWHLTNKYLKLD